MCLAPLTEKIANVFMSVISEGKNEPQCNALPSQCHSSQMRVAGVAAGKRGRGKPCVSHPLDGFAQTLPMEEGDPKGRVKGHASKPPGTQGCQAKDCHMDMTAWPLCLHCKGVS